MSTMFESHPAIHIVSRRTCHLLVSKLLDAGQVSLDRPIDNDDCKTQPRAASSSEELRRGLPEFSNKRNWLELASDRIDRELIQIIKSVVRGMESHLNLFLWLSDSPQRFDRGIQISRHASGSSNFRIIFRNISLSLFLHQIGVFKC